MGSRQSRRNRENDAIPVIRDAINLAVDASLQEAPLPIGWEQRLCPKGNRYFINHINKSTSINDPRRRTRTSKKGFKPPPYEWNFYSKTQHFRAMMHQRLHDDGFLTIQANRSDIFEASFHIINSLDSETLTRRLDIKFEGEIGLDYGGMSREWFLALSEDILDAKHKLFKPIGYEFTIDPMSSKLPDMKEKFQFVGKVIGMALYHSKLLYSYFILPFYKLLIGIKLEFDDMRYYDEQIWKSLNYIKMNTISSDLGLTFTHDLEINENGTKSYKTIELKKGGGDIPVTEENKNEYIDLVFKHYLSSTEPQFKAIVEGMSLFVPMDLMKELFNPNELQTLLGGTSEVDIEDMEANTEYQSGYSPSHTVIIWFWEVANSMTQEDLRLLLQFITGTYKVPIGGFAHLYGSVGPHKLTINKVTRMGLPAAHSCFNRLDLPEYASQDDLKDNLYYAIQETKGFDLE